MCKGASRLEIALSGKTDPSETQWPDPDTVRRHAINLITGKPRDGAFALFTVVLADKAAILPDAIPFTDGVVVPFALEAAVCLLSATEPGTALPGVATPALGLPYPSLNPSLRAR
jgi:NADPH:quinone reductase-like Zn-dependent oxidoreductase